MDYAYSYHGYQPPGPRTYHPLTKTTLRRGAKATFRRNRRESAKRPEKGGMWEKSPTQAGPAAGRGVRACTRRPRCVGRGEVGQRREAAERRRDMTSGERPVQVDSRITDLVIVLSFSSHSGRGFHSFSGSIRGPHCAATPRSAAAARCFSCQLSYPYCIFFAQIALRLEADRSGHCRFLTWLPIFIILGGVLQASQARAAQHRGPRRSAAGDLPR
jgi:hypothetical protein